jgi:hypothetical protein
MTDREKEDYNSKKTPIKEEPSLKKFKSSGFSTAGKSGEADGRSVECVMLKTQSVCKNVLGDTGKQY